jgi:hypothetical protein
MYTLIILVVGTSAIGTTQVSTSLTSQLVGNFANKPACQGAGKDASWSEFAGVGATKYSSIGWVCVQAGTPAGSAR